MGGALGGGGCRFLSQNLRFCDLFSIIFLYREGLLKTFGRMFIDEIGRVFILKILSIFYVDDNFHHIFPSKIITNPKQTTILFFFKKFLILQL